MANVEAAGTRARECVNICFGFLCVCVCGQQAISKCYVMVMVCILCTYVLGYVVEYAGGGGGSRK